MGGEKEMKNFYKTKAFLMIVSVIAAIIIWIYVVYEVNPLYETWINGVPVKCVNVSSMFDDGSLSIVGENEKILTGNYTVDVRIKGKRSLVSSVDRENINCNLDMVTVTKNGEYTLKPSVDCEISGIEISRTTPHNMKFVVEEVHQKDIEIKVETTGSEKAGYSLEALECRNETVKITGPQSVLKNVGGAKVVLNLDFLDVSDTEKSCPIVFTDLSGEEIDSGRFEKSVEYAKLSFDFYTKKTATVILMAKYKDEINKNSTGQSVELVVDGDGKKTDDGGLELNLMFEGPVSALEKYTQSKRIVYTTDIDVSGVYSDTVFEKIKVAELSNNVKYVEPPEVKVKATVDTVTEAADAAQQ